MDFLMDSARVTTSSCALVAVVDHRKSFRDFIPVGIPAEQANESGSLVGWSSGKFGMDWGTVRVFSWSNQISAELECAPKIDSLKKMNDD